MNKLKNFVKKNNKINKNRDMAIKQSREGRQCPVCYEGTLIRNIGRFGTFLGCSRFPYCRHSAPLRNIMDEAKKKKRIKKRELEKESRGLDTFKKL